MFSEQSRINNYASSSIIRIFYLLYNKSILKAHMADYNIQATKSKGKWVKSRKTNAKAILLCYNILKNKLEGFKVLNIVKIQL